MDNLHTRVVKPTYLPPDCESLIWKAPYYLVIQTIWFDIAWLAARLLGYNLNMYDDVTFHMELLRSCGLIASQMFVMSESSDHKQALREHCTEALYQSLVAESCSSYAATRTESCQLSVGVL